MEIYPLTKLKKKPLLTKNRGGFYQPENKSVCFIVFSFFLKLISITFRKYNSEPFFETLFCLLKMVRVFFLIFVHNITSVIVCELKYRI